jgi:hypothetical protein
VIARVEAAHCAHTRTHREGERARARPLRAWLGRRTTAGSVYTHVNAAVTDGGRLTFQLPAPRSCSGVPCTATRSSDEVDSQSCKVKSRHSLIFNFHGF